MRAALIYISEYEETKRMVTEGRYNNDDLLVRLRASFQSSGSGETPY